MSTIFLPSQDYNFHFSTDKIGSVPRSDTLDKLDHDLAYLNDAQLAILNTTTIAYHSCEITLQQAIKTLKEACPQIPPDQHGRFFMLLNAQNANDEAQGLKCLDRMLEDGDIAEMVKNIKVPTTKPEGSMQGNPDLQRSSVSPAGVSLPSSKSSRSSMTSNGSTADVPERSKTRRSHRSSIKEVTPSQWRDLSRLRRQVAAGEATVDEAVTMFHHANRDCGKAAIKYVRRSLGVTRTYVEYVEGQALEEMDELQRLVDGAGEEEGMIGMVWDQQDDDLQRALEASLTEQ